jgi:transcriptional regulator with XRE-family HTH domain
MPTKTFPYSEDTRRLIGANIRRLRETSGMPVTALAEGAGIKRGYWYEIESGLPNVTIDVLDRIAGELSKALGREVEARDLLTDPPKRRELARR